MNALWVISSSVTSRVGIVGAEWWVMGLEGYEHEHEGGVKIDVAIIGS